MTTVTCKRYNNVYPPELEKVSGWTVFTRFNLSQHVHLFYIELAGEIVAYALLTEHDRVPILEGVVKLAGFNYLLDYLEVRVQNRRAGLSSQLLARICAQIQEPIVLETMSDTTEFFVKRGAQYLREPVQGGVNIMVLNLGNSLQRLDSRTRKSFRKWNAIK